MPQTRRLALVSDAMRQTADGPKPLCDWPVDRPRNWKELLQAKLPDAELEQLRISVKRGRPFGSDAWIRRTADRLDLACTLRAPGRPKTLPASNDLDLL